MFFNETQKKYQQKESKLDSNVAIEINDTSD